MLKAGWRRNEKPRSFDNCRRVGLARRVDCGIRHGGRWHRKALKSSVHAGNPITARDGPLWAYVNALEVLGVWAACFAERPAPLCVMRSVDGHRPVL